MFEQREVLKHGAQIGGAVGAYGADRIDRGVIERAPRDPIAANLHSALHDLGACHGLLSEIEHLVHGPAPTSDTAAGREQPVTIGWLADQQARGLRMLAERLLALRAALA